jgi:hypothetical protein
MHAAIKVEPRCTDDNLWLSSRASVSESRDLM